MDGGARQMTAAPWLAAFLATALGWLGHEQTTPPPATPAAQSCDAIARELFGVPPTRLADPVKAPKRVHYVKPDYPEIPAGTVGRGLWVGEALIGPDGVVRKVSVLRDLEFTPPLPQFSKAIADSILKWRYAPTTVDGERVPVCMTVTVDIHWR
jgi:hypothetical protein